MVSPTFLTTLLPVPPRREQPKTPDEFRRYAAVLDVRTDVRKRSRFVSVPIVYEIGMRDTFYDKNVFKSKTWRAALQGGFILPDYRYPVADGIRASLEQRKFKYTLPPAWLDFNFDRIVCTLGGMLAMLSLEPRLSTLDFRQQGWDVRGMTQAGDAFSVQDSGTVFLDNMLGPGGSRAPLWAMVCAANIAGCEVTLPVVDCDAKGSPLGVELYGAELVRGVTVALNLLSSYYSICGVGDAFAVALTKGIHSILSVVAHSDEGGYMRDLLRRCDYVPSYGGFPQGVPLSGGVPVDDGLCEGSLVSMVDAIALATAACVAHSDPMVCEDGMLFPTVLSAGNPVGPDGVSPLSPEELGKHMARQIAGEFEGFAATYARCLTAVFGLQQGAVPGAGASALVSMASSLGEVGSRHTRVPVIAPFFWIEPTCVLPRDAFGTVAESGGSGSLASRDSTVVVPMFPGLEAVGVGNMYRSDWAMDYRSARTTPFIMFAANNRDDGLGHLCLKSFDSENVVLARMSPSEIREYKAHAGGIHFDKLLWRRGQSKLPHPAELLYTDGRVGFSILHHTMDDKGYCHPLKHIPLWEEMLSATLHLRAGGFRILEVGRSNLEPSVVKRERTRGLVALERALSEYYQTVRCVDTGVRVSEAPPPRRHARTPHSHGLAAPADKSADVGNVLPGYGLNKALIKACPQPPGAMELTAGEPSDVMCQQGAVVCPKPHPQAVHGTGPPGAAVLVGDGDGGVRPVRGDGGVVAPANANAQAVGAGQAGAAPKC